MTRSRSEPWPAKEATLIATGDVPRSAKTARGDIAGNHPARHTVDALLTAAHPLGSPPSMTVAVDETRRAQLPASTTVSSPMLQNSQRWQCGLTMHVHVVDGPPLPSTTRALTMTRPPGSVTFGAHAVSAR
jgi:hypothetical protein